MNATTTMIGAMEFTDAQVDATVALWQRVCGYHEITGTTQGHYEHSTVYLSPDVSGEQMGNAYRMPNEEEIRALVLSDGEETGHPCVNQAGINVWSGDDRLYPITLTLMAYGDYHGSDLDAANVRSLDGTPGVTVSMPGRRDDGGSATVVLGEMTSFANAQGDEPSAEDAIMWLRDLVSTLDGLSGYPLISDQTHSEYVTELADEAWDAYLRSDIESELRKMSPDGEFDYADVKIIGDPRDGDDIIRCAYYAFEENEWNAENATSVVNARHDDAVRHVAETVLGY